LTLIHFHLHQQYLSKDLHFHQHFQLHHRPQRLSWLGNYLQDFHHYCLEMVMLKEHYLQRLLMLYPNHHLHQNHLVLDLLHHFLKH
jgi:hypothetical protein